MTIKKNTIKIQNNPSLDIREINFKKQKQLLEILKQSQNEELKITEMFKDEKQKKLLEEKLKNNKKKEQTALRKFHFEKEPIFLFGNDRTITKAGYEARKDGNLTKIAGITI